MKFDPGILRNYDIRGEYNKDFDDEFAERLGSALVTYFHAKKLVLARDMRPSSDTITKALVRGITNAGADVVDIGARSTPFFYFAVTRKHGDAGAMVTASHMGEAFNGFKICAPDGMVLAKDSGLPELTAKLSAVQPAAIVGTVSTGNFLEEHSDFIIKASGLKSGEVSLSVRVQADTMIQEELAVTFERLGINVVESDPDITFVFDTDGDRISIEGTRGDLVGGLLAGEFPAGSTIVYDIRYSRGVLEFLKQKGFKLVPSKIGHTLIKRTMKDSNAVFCGEGSGHTMYQENFYAESTQLSLFKILKILTREQKTIDELVKPMETWHLAYEINTPIEGWPASVPAILEKVAKHYADGEINKLDGLKVDYPDWWFLLRASSNDPVIRLIVEARTEKLKEEKVAELQQVIAS